MPYVKCEPLSVTTTCTIPFLAKNLRRVLLMKYTLAFVMKREFRACVPDYE